MNQPYKEISKETDKIRTSRPTRSSTRQQKSSIFRSTAINLTALLLLFTLVFVLQGWGKWIGIHGNDDAKKTVASEIDSGADKKVAAVEAIETKPTPTHNPVAESKSSVYTLEEKPKAKLKAEKKKTAIKKQTIKEYQVRRVKILRKDPYAQDRQVGIEELDNELARQHYNADNRKRSEGLAADTVAEKRYQPSHTYEHSAAEYDIAPSHTTERDVPIEELDGEAARQRYNAENRRHSDPEADLK
ncbi:MAG: hypothetical protein ABH871_06750 [Pseudomonadota bacterium]